MIKWIIGYLILLTIALVAHYFYQEWKDKQEEQSPCDYCEELPDDCQCH